MVLSNQDICCRRTEGDRRPRLYRGQVLSENGYPTNALIGLDVRLRNSDHWQPTKFVASPKDDGSWIGSRKDVTPGSWLICDLLAVAYKRVIEGHARGRLIDLGCGNAPLFGIYRDRVEQIICVDWPNSVHKIPYVDVAMDLNSPLGFADEVFDTVLCTDLIEHIREPEVFWAEISRICAPAGVLIIGIPFLYGIHEAPHDYFRYTEFGLRSYCEKHGFDVIELEPFGGGPEALADLILKHLGGRRFLTATVDKLLRLLLFLPFIRHRSFKNRKSLPLGYTVVAEKRKPPTLSSHPRR